MRTIKKIVVHCSATYQGVDVNAKEIDKWHRMDGFKAIGYHYVIRLNGEIEEGRREMEPGAHCRGHNGDSIGICYVGGLSDWSHKPKDTRTKAQKASLVKLIGELRDRYGKDLPVYGHNQLTCSRPRHDKTFNPMECKKNCMRCNYPKKACPSFDVKKEFGN